MIFLKLYEQFDFEDLSDEEIFGKESNKGPYDDTLIFGKNGPEFKAGDRVVCFYHSDYNYNIINKIGTVVEYYTDGYYHICFDDDVNGHMFSVNNIPKGHGWNLKFSILKKIN